MSRARSRQRRIYLGALASGFSKGITVLTMFITVPLALTYLGAERYGLFMTISSLTLVLTFADLGLGNSLVNAVAEAHGKDDLVLAQEYISSAFFLVSGLTLLLALVFLVVQPWIPWAAVFNVTTPRAVAEAQPGITVFVICLLMSAPLGIAQRVQAGYQQGFENSLWQSFGTLLGFVGLIVAIQLRLALPWLVLALVGLPLLASVVQSLTLFFWRHPALRPRWSASSQIATRSILKLGGLFFVLQLAFALAFASDNLVAAQLLGPESVAEYSVAVRLFSVPNMILGLVFMPLWPAYTEAITRRDFGWVRQTLRRSLVLACLVAGVSSLAFMLWGQAFIQWWAGPLVTPSRGLLLGLALWAVLQTIGNAVAMFLNGANVIRLQVISSLLLAFGGLVAKITFVGWWGLAGIAWATVVAYAAFVGLPYLVMVPRLLKAVREPVIGAR